MPEETKKTDSNMYRYRILTCIVMEAASPIAVGSGQKSILTDSTVARDANGLPYIPGSSLAGVIRHAMEKHHEADQNLPDMNDWMGCQSDGRVEGSRLIVSEAKILDSSGKPADGLLEAPEPGDDYKDPLLRHFTADRLPIRQHVRISHHGTAEDMGKFDEEVVPVGTRFCFEMELMADEEKKSAGLMDGILRSIAADTFRIGSGTRSGFGAMKIVSIGRRDIDLTKELDVYLSKSSGLNPEWEGFEQIDPSGLKSHDDGFIRYTLTLKPADFMFFGSGFGSEDADMTYVRNPAVIWSKAGTGSFSEAAEEKFILIPASSVKGALSHRTAYYYNQIKEIFADDSKRFADELLPDELKAQLEEHTGDRNAAVKALFGSAGDDNGEGKACGLAIFTDVTAQNTAGAKSKLLNHVSIDRFTGGAINGALFNEETLFVKGAQFSMEILVSKKEAEKDPQVIEAFEKALDDVTDGLLPLGGGVNRGNGTFNGSWEKE